MRRRKLVALVAIALLAISAVSYAQRRRGFGGGRGGGYRGGYYQVRRPDADLLTGDFTFCRLAYRQATDGDGGGWGVDYPRADQNLSIRLSELSKTRVNFNKRDRKSTRLNSSHTVISYAVFCLKKKTKQPEKQC